MFIVIDGPDGSGKSTLAAAVADQLAAEGHPVCKTREPYLPTTRAWLFNQAVTPRELAIAFAHDRARHLHEIVRPALAQGPGGERPGLGRPQVSGRQRARVHVHAPR